MIVLPGRRSPPGRRIIAIQGLYVLGGEDRMAEEIEVTILNWEKYNQRSDVRYPTWFRIQNRVYASESLHGLVESERWVWICVLCLASQRSSMPLRFNPGWFCEEFRIKPQLLEKTLEKLSLNACVEFTQRPRCATDRQTDRQTPLFDSGKEGFDFEILYQKFPKRPNQEDNRKSDGIKKLTKRIKSQSDYELLCLAVENYSDYCKDADSKFRIKWANWIENDWKDWVDKESKSKKYNDNYERDAKEG